MNPLKGTGRGVQYLWRRAGRAARGLSDGLRLWARGLALVTSAAPGIVGVHLALTLVASLLPVMQVWLSKLVVDGLTVSISHPSGAVSAADGSGQPAVILLALLYALTVVIPAGLQPVQQTLTIWLKDRAVAEVDRRLMDAGARLADLVRIERPAFQDDLRLLQRSAMYPSQLFSFLQTGLGTAVTLAGSVLLLARLHPLLPLALVLLSAPHLVSEFRLQNLKYEAMVSRSRAAREMNYCARITTEPAAAKEIRVFGIGSFFLQRFHDRFAAAYAVMKQVRLAHLRVSAFFTALHSLAMAGGLWYVVARAAGGQLTLGDIALYLNVVIQMQSRILDLVMWFGIQFEGHQHLRGLFAFFDQAKPSIALPPQRGLDFSEPSSAHSIEMRGIHFRYPESTLPVLEDFTALLPSGKVTALVGANGAGKSTLVKLLTRMYDPDDGDILLDGVPFASYDLRSLRRRIAVVYQDFARFALTMRENIELGALEENGAGADVEDAARWAGADEVAAALPNGYETTLTRRFEGGVDLSGGEWQKVALARAFVRDAALIILDEPTAALDAEAEYRLFERFRQLVAGKTALIISHRFSTVRMADQILVLEEGRITEAGSHAELLSLGGRYAELFEMQAGRYR